MNNYESYYLAKRNLLPGAGERGRIQGNLRPGLKVHVSAVCGKAMASVACLLREFGCTVSGSDSHFNPPMSDVLDRHGITKLAPSPQNLDGIDLLIVGNTLAYSSLEPAEAVKRNIPLMSGSEAISQIFRDKRSLIVAGTHGKTTTSALLTHLLTACDQEPAYMIGGVFQATGESYSIGGKNTKFAVYEGDEYNCAFFDQAPKFLRYNPVSAIITSIEHDHVDLYPTFEDYRQAFQFLVETLPKQGFLVVHESVVPMLDLSKCRASVVTYGSSESSDVFPRSIQTDKGGTCFEIKSKKIKGVKKVLIPMFGSYNIENALAAYALARLEGLGPAELIGGLADFCGTKERQEFLGQNSRGTLILRDYAHHPTAVAVTLDALRLRYPGKKLLVVFEPCSASSRRKIFEERYARSLLKADIAILMTPTINKERDGGKDVFEADTVRQMIETEGKKAYVAEKASDALPILEKLAGHDDVVVFMSSGSMENIPEKFLSPHD